MYLDVSHVLAVRVLTEELGCSHDHIHAVYTCFDGDPCIVHVAAGVRDDLGAQTQLANGLAVLATLLRGRWRCQFNAVDAKVI